MAVRVTPGSPPVSSSAGSAAASPVAETDQRGATDAFGGTNRAALGPATAPGSGATTATTPSFRVRVIEGTASLVGEGVAAQGGRRTLLEASALANLSRPVRDRAVALFAAAPDDGRADLARVVASQGFRTGDERIQNKALDILEKGNILARAALVESIALPGFVHARLADDLALLERLERIGDTPTLREQTLALHLVAESHPDGAIGRKRPADQGAVLTRLAHDDLSQVELYVPPLTTDVTRPHYTLDPVPGSTGAWEMNIGGQRIPFLLPGDPDVVLVPTPGQVADALAILPATERVAVREVVMTGTSLEERTLAVANSIEGRITVGSWAERNVARTVNGARYVDDQDVDGTLAHEVGHLLTLGQAGWSGSPSDPALPPLTSPVPFTLTGNASADRRSITLDGRSLPLEALYASDASNERAAGTTADAVARLPAKLRAELGEVRVVRDAEERPTSALWAGDPPFRLTVYLRGEPPTAEALAQIVADSAHSRADWRAWGEAMASDRIGVSEQGITEGPDQDFADAYRLYRRVAGTTHEDAVRDAMPRRFALVERVVAFWAARSPTAGSKPRPQ